MFCECNKLSYLNISNFITSSVTNLSSMFFECNSLKSLDLNNFDTSSVISMDNLFYGCTNLLSLEINNFNFSKVNSFYHMFYGCNSLKSLNFINFYLSNISNVAEIIEGCESTLTYCTDNKEIFLNNQLFSFLNNCTYMCFVNSQKKIIIEEIKCINGDCIKDDNYAVEFNNICYLSCSEETFNLSSNESLNENSETIT